MNKLIVDEKLTPESAKDLGMVWLKDIIYDPKASEIDMKDVTDLAEQGFVLGRPATAGADNTWCGLYEKAPTEQGAF